MLLFKYIELGGHGHSMPYHLNRLAKRKMEDYESTCTNCLTSIGVGGVANDVE